MTPPRTISRVMTGQWHRVYYVLATFNVLVLVGGLLLTQQLLSMFHETVNANRVLVQRMASYSALGDRAAAVNAPGNDVFDRFDIEAQERRLDEALTVFRRDHQTAVNEAQAFPSEVRELITADLAAIDRDVVLMAAESRQIFVNLRQSGAERAARHMAAMDRRYAVVNVSIGRLRAHAREAEAVWLDQQQQRAESLQRYQAIIAVAILVLVIAATAYGYKLSQQVQADTRERERHVEELRESEAALERRVQERTAELFIANRELSALAALVRASDDAVFSMDQGGRIQTWNAAAERMFGYSAADMIGKSPELLLPPDRASEGKALRLEMASGGEVKARETVRRRKDGTTIDVAITLFSLLDQDGHRVGGVAIERDISETIAQRVRLAEKQQRLAEAERLAQLGSWRWDLTTGGLQWSDEQFRLLGFAAGDFIPTYERYAAALHPDDRDWVNAAVTHAVDTGTPLEYDHRVVCPDGTVRILHARGQLIRNAAGVPIAMSGTSQDVTERTATALALQRSEERFQLAARATSEAIWDWEIAPNTVWWSDGYLALVGAAAATAPPSREAWLARIHPSEAGHIANSLNAFMESDRTVWHEEYRYRSADATYRWILDRGYVIRDATGVAQRMIGSMMDVSERKQAERRKSDFVSFVSHQLRTPLSGMNWMLELAEESPDLPATPRGYISEAREAAARLVTLVNHLLDISRLESGQLEGTVSAVDLAGLWQSVIHEAAGTAIAKSQRVELEVSTAATVLADESLLRQVATNLLSNALKYTPDGGTIVVAVAGEGGLVRSTVTDTGIGIPKHAQVRLFEKFFRADNAVAADVDGTGLGLHVVRLIVNHFNGHVWCTSEEGTGSTFGFALPASVTPSVTVSS